MRHGSDDCLLHPGIEAFLRFACRHQNEILETKEWLATVFMRVSVVLIDYSIVANELTGFKKRKRKKKKGKKKRLIMF